MDRISTRRRSANMRAIRSTGMKPEILVRKIVHKLGHRFRLHRRDLPGKPDLVFGPKRKVIFVHGCFWHQHSNCIDGRVPKSNLGYWKAKLARNIERDAENINALKLSGWQPLVIWECETKNITKVSTRIKRFLR
ncbi:MAG TPA: DNA mismatch endonuclease Vsr [Pseudolabrys sp.]|nr:DNA mismatch endonuclease Vsr [Pseudolabrys sp.]